LELYSRSRNAINPKPIDDRSIDDDTRNRDRSRKAREATKAVARAEQ
jgi:hypothetical protein